MNSLLDLIGATAIGGMLLMTIILSLVNVQSVTSNTGIQVTLNKVTERVVNTLDEYYLASLGAGVHPDSLSILSATKTQLTFLGRFNVIQVNPDTIRIYQGTQTTNGIPLYVDVNGNRDMGPFWMSDTLNIVYYDQDEHKIPFPITSDAQKNLIRLIRIDLSLFYQGFPRNGIPSIIENKISFWKYFKNRYI